MIEGYIKKENRKRILFLCDDLRMSSGISTMAREIVLGTAKQINWISVAAAVNHPEQGKKVDLSIETNKILGIDDSSIMLYPYNGYGDADLIRNLIKIEKPDAILFFTDPRYYIWLFEIEHEVRKHIPLIYLNIWDDLPYPMYNKEYYESCDGLLAISKQTENINRVVLGDKVNNKIIKYVPHGVNENIFFPINETHEKYNDLIKFRNNMFQGNNYEFVCLWNSRNIRRKAPSDVLLAYKLFVDELPEDKAKKCAMVMHTQPVDDNGTDLLSVCKMIFGDNNEKYNIIFSNNRLQPFEMNYLYNCCDVNLLISSNEGYGISLNEAKLAGKLIIANVQGGMTDQMRFEDENGEWIKYTPEFPTNIFGKYKKCAPWAIPVFPTNMSLVGSVLTPYIYDSRCDFRDISKAINTVYNMDKEKRTQLGKEAREWTISDEAMMSSKWMCKNMVDGINETLINFKPRSNFDLVKIDYNKPTKHHTGLPLVYNK